MSCTQNTHRAIILPEAWHKWSLLCLIKFKSIAKYNFAVSKICCKLQLCDHYRWCRNDWKVIIYIFPFSNRLLQQQYHWKNYAKYSNLILDLLQAENKYNDHNTKIKFWWHEILNEFQGKTKHHHKTRVLIKAKTLLEKKYSIWQLSSLSKVWLHNL